jgi:hypothetical protein
MLSLSLELQNVPFLIKKNMFTPLVGDGTVPQKVPGRQKHK